MTNRAEFERLLDVYGFRCERFGQDLSTHARAQVVSAFAALASASVAGRQRLRELVDVVWNEATESTAVPDTPWADRLIDKVYPSLAASAPVADERAALIALCALEADGKHADESAIEAWERARAALASAPVARNADELSDYERGFAAGWDQCVASAPVAGEAQPGDYVQSVPDHCDRIVWRGQYYALPPAAPQASECECSRKSKAVSDSEAQL